MCCTNTLAYFQWEKIWSVSEKHNLYGIFESKIFHGFADINVSRMKDCGQNSGPQKFWLFNEKNLFVWQKRDGTQLVSSNGIVNNTLPVSM